MAFINTSSISYLVSCMFIVLYQPPIYLTTHPIHRQRYIFRNDMYRDTSGWYIGYRDIAHYIVAVIQP